MAARTVDLWSALKAASAHEIPRSDFHRAGLRLGRLYIRARLDFRWWQAELASSWLLIFTES
jgi:hypothetical protein